MMTTARMVLRRGLIILVVLAMAMPGRASAAPIDEARALIDAIAGVGDIKRAQQLAEVVDAMSESDLEAFSNAGIARMTDLLNRQRDAIAMVRAAGYLPPAGASGNGLPAPSTGESRTVLRDLEPNFPVYTDYTPDTVSCPNSPNQTVLADLLITKAVLTGLQTAYKVAKAAYDIADGGCSELIVAIGVGSNPQTFVCVGLGIAETALRVAFDIVDAVVDMIGLCDSEVDYARIRSAYNGLLFIHQQLTDHDTEMKLQLATHDVEVQALIDDLIARLVRIEGKFDLMLKSQLQIVMDRKGGRSRPSVFYEERLDELCDYAQEAADGLPDVYLIAPQVHGLIAKGLSLKATDPKLAADTCVQAFVKATANSATLQ